MWLSSELLVKQIDLLRIDGFDVNDYQKSIIMDSEAILIALMPWVIQRVGSGRPIHGDQILKLSGLMLLIDSDLNSPECLLKFWAEKLKANLDNYLANGGALRYEQAVEHWVLLRSTPTMPEDLDADLHVSTTQLLHETEFHQKAMDDDKVEPVAKTLHRQCAMLFAAIRNWVHARACRGLYVETSKLRDLQSFASLLVKDEKSDCRAVRYTSQAIWPLLSYSTGLTSMQARGGSVSIASINNYGKLMQSCVNI